MRHTAFLAAILTFGANAFAADQDLLNLVMPDAQVMAGVNVTKAKISPFGQYIVSRISADDAKLQDLIRQTGFDPRLDVSEILAASAANPTSPGGLLLARGNFNVAQIVAAIPAGAKRQVQTYNGATLISGNEGKTPHALAFINTSIAVVGDLASVKAAIDRSTGINSINAALAAQVHTLSSTEDAWSVSLASLAALMPGAAASPAGPAAQTLQLVRNIQSASGGVTFGNDVVFTAQAVADSAQDASALADVIRMIATLASAAGGRDAHLAQAAQLLQSLKVAVDGSSVNLSGSFPEAQIEALIASAPAHPAGSHQGAIRNRRM